MSMKTVGGCCSKRGFLGGGGGEGAGGELLKKTFSGGKVPLKALSRPGKGLYFSRRGKNLATNVYPSSKQLLKRASRGVRSSKGKLSPRIPGDKRSPSRIAFPPRGFHFL